MSTEVTYKAKSKINENRTVFVLICFISYFIFIKVQVIHSVPFSFPLFYLMIYLFIYLFVYSLLPLQLTVSRYIRVFNKHLRNMVKVPGCGIVLS